MNYRLYKKEKLCSKTAIDRLFEARLTKGAFTDDGRGRVGVGLCYPLRAVFAENRVRGGAPVQFLISVPKKRLRRAVDRVTMRRRIREAYRLNRFWNEADEQRNPLCAKVDVAFIYVANELVPYQRVQRAVHRLLDTIYNSLSVIEKGDEEA